MVENWKEKILDKIYNDPSSAAGFAGVEQLLHDARLVDKRIKKKDVKEYLEGHRTYTLHRPRRVHFQRSKTIPAGFMTAGESIFSEVKRSRLAS